MMGTASLFGGHGTSIAWGPVMAGEYGIAGAAELGIASATVGLILASLVGGPIANYLIRSRDLKPAPVDEPPATAAEPEINHANLMRTLLWLHVAIGLGMTLYGAFEATGIKLPLFVPCLLSGIFLTNTVPNLLPRIDWPTGTKSLALISEFSLSVFLSMSLMSMELWTLAGSAGVLAFTMLLETVAAAAFIMLVVFRLMGGDYFAAVMSAGFAGFALGATPTAIANMTAVTQRFGPAPLAFIVLPLVSAFFVDIVNMALIKWSITLLVG
jgi:ESS family glutamate:Na+ symporter